MLRRTSTVGCGVCYEAFRDVLRAGIMSLHGSLQHGQPKAVCGRLFRAPAPQALMAGDWLESLFGLCSLEWLSGQGPDSDVALSTRLRLARNLSRHAFPSAAEQETLESVLEQVWAALDSLLPHWLKLSPGDLQGTTGALLAERHLLATAHQERAAVVGFASLPGGRESLIVNEEDHLRLQTLRSGLALGPALDDLLGSAAALERALGFAHSERLGYLTACPSNLGTGLRASVLLHLPALAWYQALPEVMRKVARAGGLTLRGLHGEESPLESPFLQLSNQVTLGHAEAELVANVESVASSLIAWERRARGSLLQSRREALEDSVWRAWGLLEHARLIGPEEAVEQLSLVRLGCLLGILPRQAGPPERAIRLLIGMGEAHLQRGDDRRNGAALDPARWEAERASYLRANLRQRGRL
jgi:protein arginine kinase